MTARMAMEWLHSCAGCEMALLDTGTAFMELLEQVDLVHCPLLMDHKHHDREDGRRTISIPEAEIGLVSGSVANEEHLEVLRAMRRQCGTLVALGTCAAHGGIPAFVNATGLAGGVEATYATLTTEPCRVPSGSLPRLLDRVHAVDEQVAVDLVLPGCPPEPQLIADVIIALAGRREPELPARSVCDTCPTRREGTGDVKRIRRFLENAEYEPDRPVDAMRCLLEQGFLCMGPVTAAGCAGESGAPPCLRARVPCRGCFGPVRPRGNQMLDMMNVLASNSIDFRSVVDRRSLLRFSGAHGLLRPRTPGT